MTGYFKRLTLFTLLGAILAPLSANAAVVEERVLGKSDAPVTVEEYVSLTCSHCADFYNDTLPELEKRYVETGKVKFILRDFPLDGIALKAAALAHCMPAEQYYPFIKVVFKNQAAWIATEGGPEKTLMQYAQLGGLSEEKAKACLEDTKLQEAITAVRAEGTKKHKIEATPTFVINNGAKVLRGSQSVDNFAAAIDPLLGKKQ